MQTQEMASMDSNLRFFGDTLARATREARAARLCARLEAEAPGFVAELIARVPPEVAGDVVDELLRRD